MLDQERVKNRAHSTDHVAVVMIIVVMGLAAWPGLAQSAGKVTEYGVYDANNSLILRTRDIPAGKPVRFGFCFEANIDFPEDRYMLVETLVHPPVPSNGSGEDVGYSVPRMFEVRNGVARGCSGYRARNESDLRPGVWKFTISDGDEELVVQEFTIK